MAEVAQRELVYCHACNDEWYRDEHGLQCPRCESEIVEIVSTRQTMNPDSTVANDLQIEPDSDPRTQLHEDDSPDHDEHSHPIHNHNPWARDAPDPDEDDIDHVEWNGPGVHFTRTTIRRGPGQGPQMGDPFSPLFSGLMGISRNMRSPMQDPESERGGRLSAGPPPMRNTFTINFGPGLTRGTVRQNMDTDDLAGIFQQFMEDMHSFPRGAAGSPGSNRRPPPILAMLSQILSPANARAGDAVFSQEALDRVISGLMEQHSSSSAPGPASDNAIAALPKIRIAKSHLDSTGKAECSICMDGLDLGDEVTELPCHHWFHGDCVGAWLREHDTCPQCRRGITPKDGDVNSPRATGQAPRFWQMQGNEFEGTQDDRSIRTPEANRSTLRGSGTSQSPYQVPESPSAGPSSRSQRRDNDSGRNRIGGWLGRAFGGSSNNSSSSSSDRRSSN